ncbi:MAG: phosphatase PAP2 family protein [Elusimicrobiales bacterium]|nr:phosphatase PAP2 family protein [Elusimicrobiales bacterium]
MNVWKKQSLLIFAALALGACAHNQPELTGQQPAQQAYYVNAEPFKSAQFSPPPVPGSMQQEADIAAVLSWQNKRTEADCAKSRRTSEETYDSFWAGKSPFPEPLPAEVKNFFERLASDLGKADRNMKERYRRPRPFMAYPEAKPCIKKPESFSYPSGHALYSRLFASVLADIVPDRRSEFFAKADEIARDRVIGGVHYPADITAGKAFADIYHDELLKSEAYRKDIEKMKALLLK